MDEKRPWLRRVLIALAAALWLTASVPLSAYGVSRALGALAIATLVRAVYRALAKRWRPTRPFLVPSLFVLAAAFAVLGTIGRTIEREGDARANAVRQGVVTEGDAASSVDLCVAGNLTLYDGATTAGRQGLTRRQFRTFAEQLCAEANRQGFLRTDGTATASDTTKLQDEARRIIQQMQDNGDL